MNATITQNDLFLYYYGETNPQTTLRISRELQSSLSLKKDYEEILKITTELDTAFAEPNDTSVQIVMEESLSSNLEQTI